MSVLAQEEQIRRRSLTAAVPGLAFRQPLSWEVWRGPARGCSSRFPGWPPPGSVPAQATRSACGSMAVQAGGALMAVYRTGRPGRRDAGHRCQGASKSGIISLRPAGRSWHRQAPRQLTVIFGRSAAPPRRWAAPRDRADHFHRHAERRSKARENAHTPAVVRAFRPAGRPDPATHRWIDRRGSAPSCRWWSGIEVSRDQRRDDRGQARVGPAGVSP